MGAAAASSYAVSDRRAHDGQRLCGQHPQRGVLGRAENDDRFAYVTNFGDGTVSCYEITADRSLRLHEPVAGSNGRREGPPRRSDLR